MDDKQKKNILVTGGGQNFGLRLVKNFLACRDFRVIILTRNPNKLKKELKEYKNIFQYNPIDSNSNKILINKRNNLVSREELADKEFDESELRKVDVGITRLRQKIEKIPKKPQFIKTIRSKGYMLVCREI